MHRHLVFACVLLAVSCARTTALPAAGGDGGGGAASDLGGTGAGTAGTSAPIEAGSGGGGAVASGGAGGLTASGGSGEFGEGPCMNDGDPCMGGAGACCRGVCAGDCYPEPWWSNPAPNCDVLGVAACIAQPGCRTIEAWPFDDDDARVDLIPLGCTRGDRVCADQETCARASEGAPEYVFPSSCIPAGWIGC